MDCILGNNTRQLLIVTLNSGQTLHLAPGGASGPLDDMELNDNAKVAKLRGSGVLSLTTREGPVSAPRVAAATDDGVDSRRRAEQPEAAPAPD